METQEFQALQAALVFKVSRAHPVQWEVLEAPVNQVLREQLVHLALRDLQVLQDQQEVPVQPAASGRPVLRASQDQLDSVDCQVLLERWEFEVRLELLVQLDLSDHQVHQGTSDS